MSGEKSNVKVIIPKFPFTFSSKNIMIYVFRMLKLFLISEIKNPFPIHPWYERRFLHMHSTHTPLDYIFYFSFFKSCKTIMFSVDKIRGTITEERKGRKRRKRIKPFLRGRKINKHTFLRIALRKAKRDCYSSCLPAKAVRCLFSDGRFFGENHEFTNLQAAG